ncbi:MAG: di-trans,poly-cis-decaprenylcistransferase [Gammaproteobacteria bacterium]
MSLHVAIIMDGNGRWARARGLPRPAGHRAGSHAVRRAVRAAPGLGITTLTLYAFSSDNWQRPASEVEALMELFERYLATEAQRCLKNGVRISVIGRRDRLRPSLLKAIEKAEAKTAGGTRLHLRIAVDYSARAAIAAAAAQLPSYESYDSALFSMVLNQVIHSVPAAPDVDILIRTGGEQRLSDFLLWECAYAELVFSERHWPDFDENDLAQALAEFQRRDRRFGRVSEAVL